MEIWSDESGGESKSILFVHRTIRILFTSQALTPPHLLSEAIELGHHAAERCASQQPTRPDFHAASWRSSAVR